MEGEGGQRLILCKNILGSFAFCTPCMYYFFFLSHPAFTPRAGFNLNNDCSELVLLEAVLAWGPLLPLAW